jgi:hypothetical protein
LISLEISSFVGLLANFLNRLASLNNIQVCLNKPIFLLSYMSTKNEDDNEPSTELIKQVLSFNEDLNALQSKIKITIRNVKYIRKSIKGMLEKS